jgi:hypothetical protein
MKKIENEITCYEDLEQLNILIIPEIYKIITQNVVKDGKKHRYLLPDEWVMVIASCFEYIFRDEDIADGIKLLEGFLGDKIGN